MTKTEIRKLEKAARDAEDGARAAAEQAKAVRYCSDSASAEADHLAVGLERRARIARQVARTAKASR